MSLREIEQKLKWLQDIKSCETFHNLTNNFTNLKDLLTNQLNNDLRISLNLNMIHSKNELDKVIG